MHGDPGCNLYPETDWIPNPPDPEFINPGSGKMGFTTLDGYKIKPGSPAINSGKRIPGQAAKDFRGNIIQEDQKPDRGAMEYISIPK